MKCRYCQAEIGQEDNFCIQCGRSTTISIKESKKCRYCGEKLPYGSDFCIKCGHAVENPMEDEIFLKRNGYAARKESKRKVIFFVFCAVLVIGAVIIGLGAQPNHHANVEAHYYYVGEIGGYDGLDDVYYYPVDGYKFVVYAVKVASYDLDRTDISLWVKDVRADLTKGKYAPVHKTLNGSEYTMRFYEINPDFEVPYKYQSTFYLLFYIEKNDYPIGLTY